MSFLKIIILYVLSAKDLCRILFAVIQLYIVSFLLGKDEYFHLHFMFILTVPTVEKINIRYYLRKVMKYVNHLLTGAD